ncbi:MAG: hypothetical protein GY792_08215 [Gammaproteobacteria bacterium]|nr:hypothetical protein [Gammaproteobacteria bacterium]
MYELAVVDDDKTRTLLDAWCNLNPKEREEILWLAQNPEEFEYLIRFEEISIE